MRRQTLRRVTTLDTLRHSPYIGLRDPLSAKCPAEANRFESWEDTREVRRPISGHRGQPLGKSALISAEDSPVVDSVEVKEMNMRKLPSFLILTTVAVMVLSATPATAQGDWISYAAKFVCNATGDDAAPAMTGKYRTVVNIHNPHNWVPPQGSEPIPAMFYKKVVLSQPQGDEILQPSCHQQEFLKSDEALAVTCENIKALLSLSGLPTTGLLEGFVVLEVPPQWNDNTITPTLDVDVVYTARPRTGTSPDVKIYDVRTMDVERVEPTTVIGDPEQRPCGPV